MIWKPSLSYYEVYATRTARGLMTGLCASNRPLAAGAAPFGGLPGAPGAGLVGVPPAVLGPLVLLAGVGAATLTVWRTRPTVWRRRLAPRGAGRDGDRR